MQNLCFDIITHAKISVNLEMLQEFYATFWDWSHFSGEMIILMFNKGIVMLEEKNSETAVASTAPH